MTRRHEDEENNVQKTQEEHLLDLLQYLFTYHSARDQATVATRATNGNGNSAENRVDGQPDSRSNNYPIDYTRPEDNNEALPKENKDGSSGMNSDS